MEMFCVGKYAFYVSSWELKIGAVRWSMQQGVKLNAVERGELDWELNRESLIDWMLVIRMLDLDDLDKLIKGLN